MLSLLIFIPDNGGNSQWKPQMETSPIVDSSENEEIDIDFLTCPICTEIFTKPVTLKCSHVYCKKCLKEWLRMNKTCPECRLFIKSKYVHTNKPLDSICKKVKESVKEGDDMEHITVIARRASRDLDGGEIDSAAARIVNDSLGRDRAYVRQRLPANNEFEENETQEPIKTFYDPTDAELRQVARRTRHVRRWRITKKVLRWLLVALMAIGFILILVLI